MEIRRLEKLSQQKKEVFAKRTKPINFIEDEPIDIERFRHNPKLCICFGQWCKQRVC